MNKPGTATDRRSFLKSGAIAAAPLAAVVPGAALAMDDSAARLARMEDERAIEALHRGMLRSLNTRALGDDIARLTPDMNAEARISIATDGRSATARHACVAEFITAAGGETTVERMTRFQGHGSAMTSEQRTLVAEFTKNEQGWGIARVHLA